MPEFVVVCDALIFNDSEKVLFQKRKSSNKPDMWATPGGKLKKGEKLEDAVVREALEEHGIDIKVIEYFHHSEVIRPKNHYIYFTYIAKLINGTPEIMEPDKCGGVGFFDLYNLPEPMTSQTQDYISKYLNSKF